MKIKTSELTGAALDWAVATAIGWSQAGHAVFNCPAWVDENRKIKYVPAIAYKPSTNWAHGGPLRDKFMISLFEDVDTGKIEAIITAKRNDVKQFPWQRLLRGPTALIAICRAVVALNLGDDVELPDELAQGGAA